MADNSDTKKNPPKEKILNKILNRFRTPNKDELKKFSNENNNRSRMKIPFDEYSDKIEKFWQDGDIFAKSQKLFKSLLKKFRKKSSMSARSSKKKRCRIVNFTSGRNTKLLPYKKGQNLLSLLPTIKKAIFNGNFSYAERKFHISRKDFLGWEKSLKESMTLIFLIDSSKSIIAYKLLFAEVIKSMANYFNKNNDRIGLITLQGKQAQIHNHPTHNYRIIQKSLRNLQLKGETPLGDGLLKAITMAKLERTKNPGSKSLVVLLSDCFPEPITRNYPNILDEPIYKEAINAAKIYRKTKTALLIINPSYRKDEERQGEKYSGEKLTDIIISETKGKLFKMEQKPFTKLFPTEKENVFDFNQQSNFSQKDITKILTGIENAFNDI